jgi:hypothetical protein
MVKFNHCALCRSVYGGVAVMVRMMRPWLIVLVLFAWSGLFARAEEVTPDHLPPQPLNSSPASPRYLETVPS